MSKEKQLNSRIATNKKAFRDYNVLETTEAGIELAGSEVKSLRQAKANLGDSFARIEKNQALLYHLHISPYEQASYLNVDPDRVRRLLLHKSEIIRLRDKVDQKGFTIMPLVLYFNDRGLVKVQLGLCQGKKLYDRREDIKKRESDRELRRAMKYKNRR